MARDDDTPTLALSQDDRERLRQVLSYIIEDRAIWRLLPEHIAEDAMALVIWLGQASSFGAPLPPDFHGDDG